MDVLVEPSVYSGLAMATHVVKPKERQFQVVPVPAIFTRGRWECRDFKEPTSVENQILEFVEKNPSSTNAASEVPSTLPLAGINPRSAILAELPTRIVSHDSSTASVSTMTGSMDSGAHLQNPSHATESSASNTMGQAGAGNIVAIDNKIEQAMDLVKTHLTFAVREEVEILRSQIADLESQVTHLESENQILRQFAPSDIVTKLPLLIQQQQHKATVPQQLLVNTSSSETFPSQASAVAPSTKDSQTSQQVVPPPASNPS
ncbi:TSC-22/dip/bun family domain-containing protein [Ditylenchus destructor]|uniref:TSC-22/dip/bun family domain-containing protein n=1 Tax=Ditylenchus destructor TaxID=166010 RepID=A0AAD4N4B0_9BILA|nr:TSC-22/dip/bun family domain-containing protein [Ditylenchus destructor]